MEAGGRHSAVAKNIAQLQGLHKLLVDASATSENRNFLHKNCLQEGKRACVRAIFAISQGKIVLRLEKTYEMSEAIMW